MNFWNDPTRTLPKQKHRWVISLGQTIDYSAAFSPEGAASNFFNAKKFGFQNVIPKYWAKAVDRPTYSLKAVQAKYLYSHTINFPTRVVWNPITITFYDVGFRSFIIGENSKQFSFFEPPTRKVLRNPKIRNEFNEEINKAFKITSFNNAIGIETDNEFVDQNYNPFELGVGSGEVDISTQMFFYAFLNDARYFSPNNNNLPKNSLFMKSYNFKDDMIRAIGDIKIDELDEAGKPKEQWVLKNPLITDLKFDKLDYAADDIATITATISYDWAELLGSNSAAASLKKANDLEAEQRIKQQKLIDDRNNLLRKIAAQNAAAEARKKELDKEEKNLKKRYEEEIRAAADKRAKEKAEKQAALEREKKARNEADAQRQKEINEEKEENKKAIKFRLDAAINAQEEREEKAKRVLEEQQRADEERNKNRQPRRVVTLEQQEAARQKELDDQRAAEEKRKAEAAAAEEQARKDAEQKKAARDAERATRREQEAEKRKRDEEARKAEERQAEAAREARDAAAAEEARQLRLLQQRLEENLELANKSASLSQEEYDAAVEALDEKYRNLGLR
jgi:hypothetical protein